MKFCLLFGTHRFISLSTRAYSWTTRTSGHDTNKSNTQTQTYFSIIVPSTTRSSRSSLPFRFPCWEIVLISHVLIHNETVPNLTSFTNLIICGVECAYRLRRSLLCEFIRPAVSFCRLRLNILRGHWLLKRRYYMFFHTAERPSSTLMQNKDKLQI